MTWLVVGASGQLGKSVCDVLDARRIKYVGANSTELDITKPLLVKSFVEFLKPAVIVNAAAYTNVDGAETSKESAKLLNSNGPGNLALAAKGIGAVFVHVSTDYVFSGTRNLPYLEEAIRAPQSVYGETKAQGEQNVLDAYSSKSYVIRTAWLYSAYRNNFAKTMVKLASKDEADVLVVTDQVGQPTFARDLALQIVESIQKKIPFGVYHGTNSGQASWFEFAQEIFRLVGADVARVKPVGSDAFPRPAKRPAYSVLGHDKWVGSGVDEMRDWKISLAEAMPAIVSAVKAEG